MPRLLIVKIGAWLVGVAVLLATLAALLAGNHLQIQTDLLALLPTPQRDPVKSAAMQRIASLGERRVAILVSADETAQRQKAALAIATKLAASDAFIKVISNANDLLDNEQRQAFSDLYFRHRFHLLAPSDRAALKKLAGAKDATAALAHFTQRAQTRLYGIGLGNGDRFIDDPFGLAAAYRSEVAGQPALPGIRVAASGEFYAENAAGERYSAVFAQTRADPFSMDAQGAQTAGLQAALDAARAITPQAEILVSGVLRHAAAATRTARNEITLIGGGSLAGILLLMLWAFASLRPFLLSVLAIAGGCLLAIVATASLFGGVHILTLVFGASLVGVAIDYCFHFFAERWHTPAPDAALARIFPAITLGLITSVLAYGGMALAPFPALRQMAVFAAFGLIGAWLGVVLLLPALAGRTAPRSGSVVRVAAALLAHGPARFAQRSDNALLWCLGAAFVVCTGLSLIWLAPDDDIRLLYNATPELRYDEQQVSSLLGTKGAGRALAVSGKTAEQVLKNEAGLVRALNKSTKPVAEYTAITQAYPPVAQQQRDYKLLASTLYRPDGPVDKLLAEVGFSPQSIREHHADFAQAQARTLAFDDWLSSPAGAAMAPFWLGHADDPADNQTGGQWASLILLHEIHDPQRLSQILASQSSVIEIDRVAEISALFSRYRGLASALLGAAYLVAWLVLCVVFGLRGALIVLLAPLLASAATALFFAVTGWPFSLFNLMAMVLLLGMGADYGIFLRMAGTSRKYAMAAVGLSAMTTLLAFGLLALSNTPALHSFGLTLALGLTLTFLIASTIGDMHNKPKTA